MKNRAWCVPVAIALILGVSEPGKGQEAFVQAPGGNMADMKFTAFPGLPTCIIGSVQNGDPAKGPSIILAKAAAGCTVPWHWHTPNEHIMMVSGVANLEMKGGQPLALQAGGFAMMSSRHIHQFRCGAGPCVFYLYTDAVFDIHYVDTQEKEITPDLALRTVGETVVKEMNKVP
ncbi:hypothetical protein GSbR_09950 [Geobacter sp. SVR]|nr:hypothetical protein GSVR_13180 [Geobacter sp. SVR]GCF84395.1 hypothetical protein GSbR_09950 [Geobacter sp. SVR]